MPLSSYFSDFRKRFQEGNAMEISVRTELENYIEQIGLTYVPEVENNNLCFANNNSQLRDDFKRVFAPIDLQDYIYAVVHSPIYREKYKEFLKIDFSEVPYPKDTTTFWKLVRLGGELRQIHLLECSKVLQFITQFPINGNNEVTHEITKTSPGYVPDNDTHGKVYINDTQYFDNVPLVAWEFYMGGYQPAQQWLKYRKQRTLSYEDILHYQKFIVAICETDRIMQTIDKIGIEA